MERKWVVLSSLLLLAGLTAIVGLQIVPQSLANNLFDLYQRLFPRARVSAPVVIVAVDEASLARYGQWPWPRSLLARLLHSISADGPAAVGFDILMPEQDRSSACDVMSYVPEADPALKERACRLPSNDEVFAAALHSAPAVVGMAGLDGVAPNGSGLPTAAAVLARGADPQPYLRRFQAALTNVEVIDRAASGHGLLSADTDSGVLRRLPLAGTVADTVVPSLAIEMLRVAAGQPAFVVTAEDHGVTHVGLTGLPVATQSDGTLFVRYGRHDPSRFVSASDVLAGKLAPETFDRKLVLIAVTALGLGDHVFTPLGERVPGAEVHAQVMESVFDATTLLRPGWAAFAEAAAVGIPGLALIGCFARFGALATIPLVAVGLMGLAAGGSYLYDRHGLLLDAAGPAIGILLVYGYLVVGTMVEVARQRAFLRRELAAQREAAARLAGELEAAQRIQIGMLPKAQHAFPAETRFEVAAAMRPAREVGGDLYDFFMVDNDRLFLLIGDVAGKGLPASLFMVVSKVLVKSAALADCGHAGTLASRANREICRDNPELLFVTAVFAVVDLRTWEVEFAVAGHEGPYRVSLDGTMQQLYAEGGPPLCVLDECLYPTERAQLAPGETLVFFTDGVTEAMDAHGALFGRDRLEGALRSAAGDSASRLVEAVCGAVDRFSSGLPASDDSTVLAVRRVDTAFSAR